MPALALMALVLCACAEVPGRPPEPAPRAAGLDYPPTRTDGVEDLLHGVRVKDPYRWLEDESSAEVQAWMAAEDHLARAYLAGLPGRAALAARLRELLYVGSMTVPVKRGPLLFYERRRPDEEKARLVVREAAGRERVLLDPNLWSTDGSLALGEWSVSWDGRTVAYLVRPNAADEATLHVLDVPSGAVSAVDTIAGAKFAEPSFDAAGRGFYYAWYPPQARARVADQNALEEVRFHRLGADPVEDELVRGPTGDPESFQSARLSRDGHYLFLSVEHGWSRVDLFFRDARLGPQAPFRELAVGRDAVYQAFAYRDRLYVRTDEGAPRYRLFRVDPARPARAEWEELVPEGAGTAGTLEDAAVLGGALVLRTTERASSRLGLYDLDGRHLRDLALPSLGDTSLPSGEEDDPRAYFSFESFTSPRAVYAFHTAGGEPELLFRPEVPFDPDRYQVEQVHYPSRDGTPVSMFLVHARGLARDGRAPVLLYGYGGFNLSLLPSFRPDVLPWLERGGVFAVPNLRGGGEHGEAWHRAGMLLEKQNVFDDFIAAARWLVGAGVTRPGRIAIRGGSNGGLLVGAAMTERPELFAAVLCAVPLLDMLRYPLFGLGKAWIPEYGSPEVPAQFRALLAYSPYHRVVPGTRYPALLVLSSDHDDRVDPMHARKFVAAVQAATLGGPALLRIERQAGHGGADLRRARVEQEADAAAFAFAALGVEP
ncbi:MAG TPA: prolyl oligopeptidase family serine peptidase [Anaeromyxobacteraceae bacterium]|nr:prolyl oligopeptidase family serine peptidase [Anaeromyxobacteraceae bacterium]